VMRSMGLHDLARKKIEAAITSAMINLYIKRMSSVESQKIAQLIGPVGTDRVEFRRRVHALFALIWPTANSDSETETKSSLLKIGFTRLKIKILKAENLPKMDRFGSIDPYCTLSLGAKMERTTTKKNTQNPCWDTEEFIFEIDPSAKDEEIPDLVIKVMDWDQLGDNQMAGETKIEGKRILAIMKKGPGDAPKAFELIVNVDQDVGIQEASYTTCRECFPKSEAIDITTSEPNSTRTFQMSVEVESMEPVIAGSEISKLREFAMKYDVNQVSRSFRVEFICAHCRRTEQKN